jgi:hypothetical protein
VDFVVRSFVVIQNFFNCGFCVSTSFSTQFLILLRVLHTICWQQAKQSYEKILFAIGAKRVTMITIDARAKIAQVGAKRGHKLWWFTFSILMNFL